MHHEGEVEGRAYPYAISRAGLRPPHLLLGCSAGVEPGHPVAHDPRSGPGRGATVGQPGCYDAPSGR
jgi:hypothetical protein